MAFIPNSKINTGLFVPTTDVYEVSKIGEVDVNSQEFKLLLVRLYQNLNVMAIALNLKDSGYYVLEQFVNGQVFFPTEPNTPNSFRQCFRLVVDVGNLGAGITSVNHNITVTNNFTFTRIYGTATDNTLNNFYPIPFAGAAGAYISLRANATQVVIDNNSGVTFNKCLVILEFLKN